MVSETVAPRYLPFSPRIHAYLITVIPGLAFAGGIALAFAGHPPTLLDLGAFLAMYFIAIAGVSIGFHRHFTHTTFSAKPWLRKLFVILGSFSGEGPVIYWVAVHRRHHQKADLAGDPHSPYIKGERSLHGFEGFFHSQFGWLFDHDVPSTLYYARDLLREPQIVRISQRYYLWMILGMVLPGAICGAATSSGWAALTGALWGGPIRLFIGTHAASTINSFTHLVGRRHYRCNDQSRNVGWLSIITLGESWHNNHHAFPSSARFGFEWWQLDFGAAVIGLLRRLGWVWDVKYPTLEQRSKRRLEHAIATNSAE